jgi:hypothetical protein
MSRLRHWYPRLLLVVAILVACGREPKLATNEAAAGVQPVPFHGETYRMRSGRSAITLISADELEYTHNGTIFLCKYSKQGDALRVVMTALGTQQVLYFRRIQAGLVSNDGDLYLSPSGMAEIEKQEENVRVQQQAARDAEQKQRAEAERLAAIEAQRQAEEQRRADAAERPLVEKQLVGRWGFQDYELAITRDAGDFVVIAKYSDVNTKETLRGQLLPDNTLELTSVKIEALRPEFPARWGRKTTWIKLQPDKTSLQIKWENGGSDSRYRRLSESP